MQAQPAGRIGPQLKQPHGLSPRIQWLRDYYFEGVKRSWNNEFTCWTTGTPWDVLYDETHLLHRPRDLRVPPALSVFRASGGPAGEAAPGLLEVEPAGAARLVHP